MAAEERDRLLDGEDSDGESSQGYQSEEELQKGGRSSKRRRVEADEEEEDGSDIDGFSDDEDEEKNAKVGKLEDGKTTPTQEIGKASAQRDQEEAGEGKGPLDSETKQDLPGFPNALTKRNLVATEAAIKKSGVIYLSRIPPFMKPHKLRSLLEPYGKINRIFLSPESDEARSRRLRNGGNRKRLFTEGWVEFVSKKDAKAVCEILNARTIGGKKGSYYRDDVWTLLYLNGFKWHNLTEQIANENAERASRMRAEISKATKENKAFVRNVEQAKMLDGIKSKTAAKRKRAVEAGDVQEGQEAGDSSAAPANDTKRRFKQAQLAKKRDQEDQPEQVTRVLSKIF